jgi:hypothetical protein
MSIRPKFYRHTFPDTKQRNGMSFGSNACTRQINIEIGKRLFQIVWTRTRHLDRVKRANMAAR